MMVVLRIEGRNSRFMRTAAHKPRPEFNRLGRLWTIGAIGGQIAEWRIREQLAVPAVLGKPSHQGTMPVNLVQPHAHRRIEKAIPERASAADLLAGGEQLTAAGV